MTRVKRGKISLKRRRNILKKTKGYRFGRSAKERQAREAIMHAGVHAFAHRRDKKNDFRRLWQIQINAFARERLGMPYNKLISSFKKAKIGLNRKILAGLAEKHPEVFERIANTIIKK
jgi:large subunit ribosomal protein L20